MIDFSKVASTRLKNPTDVIPLLIERFQNQKRDFDLFVPEQKVLSFVCVDFEQMRRAMMPVPDTYLTRLKNLLPKKIR